MKSYRRIFACAAVALGLTAMPAVAQVTPAQGFEPVDDTPSVKLGGVIYADYTYNQEPQVTDTDANKIKASAFNITRAYINAFATISHLVSARITTDTTADTNSADTALNGSNVIRLKYAFGQINFDEWVGKGSWLRIGLQQTPWIDYAEGIYRYRFQSKVFTDAEGFLTSSDYGFSGHYNLPSNYGDIHLGWYNGEGYTSFADSQGKNNQKGFEIRGAIRPVPDVDVIKGLRVALFYDSDNYVKDAKKERFLGNVTFESPYVNAGFEYLKAKDQKASASTAEVTADGYSVWVTPRSTIGIEGLIRYDDLKPNHDINARKKRTIVGVAYWFPVQKGVTSALMLDYTQVKYDAALGKPETKAWAVHTQFTF